MTTDNSRRMGPTSSPSNRWSIYDATGGCGTYGDGWCVFDFGECVAQGIASEQEAIAKAQELYAEESRPAVVAFADRVIEYMQMYVIGLTAEDRATVIAMARGENPKRI